MDATDEGWSGRWSCRSFPGRSYSEPGADNEDAKADEDTAGQDDPGQCLMQKHEGYQDAEDELGQEHYCGGKSIYVLYGSRPDDEGKDTTKDGKIAYGKPCASIDVKTGGQLRPTANQENR